MLSILFFPCFIQISNSDTPSPPPGLSKSNPVIPISSSNHSARSPFEGAVTESQSLFSDNFRHPNPIPSGLPPFPSSPQTSSDWPTAPEPQSLFTSGGCTAVLPQVTAYTPGLAVFFLFHPVSFLIQCNRLNKLHGIGWLGKLCVNRQISPEISGSIIFPQ